FTARDSPSTNGVAERMNFTLLQKVRSIFADSGLPIYLWTYAVKYATLLHNIVKSPSPWVSSFGRKPNFLHKLLIFGQRVYFYAHESDKLKDKGAEGYFVHYDCLRRGYYVFTGRSVIYSRDVTPGKLRLFKNTHAIPRDDVTLELKD